MPIDVTDRNVLVMGLGRFGGGVGVTRWLCGAGAKVTVTDLADQASLVESVRQLQGCPVRYRLGGHDPTDLHGMDLLVVSPAVDRRTNAFFAAAVDAGIAWTTEINLFVERCRAPWVGVTGTAGKSTASAMLQAALTDNIPTGGRVWFGGNVGRSLLGELDRIAPRDVVILELSSFQLDALAPLGRGPHIGLITNCWPNHLDRHHDFEAYLQAKLNLFRHQQPGDWAVVGQDDALIDSVERITRKTGAQLVTARQPVEAYALRIPGRHNQGNAACAAKVAELLGADSSNVRQGLSKFAGLPHRLEHVGAANGVDFYNDSKSTTPAGTATALASFDRPVVLLVGGQDRDDDLGPLVEAARTSARAVVCMGPMGLRLNNLLADSGLTVTVGLDLDQAVAQARTQAEPGDVVLLSPGAPSYDQFVNYEQRGRRFGDCVRQWLSQVKADSTAAS
ncbi:MAG: UDP-N-acetylmuramoyl-L-alanine--D-glutamate ligase [Phycisphaerae bacterium]